MYMISHLMRDYFKANNSVLIKRYKFHVKFATNVGSLIVGLRFISAYLHYLTTVFNFGFVCSLIVKVANAHFYTHDVCAINCMVINGEDKAWKQNNRQTHLLAFIILSLFIYQRQLCIFYGEVNHTNTYNHSNAVGLNSLGSLPISPSLDVCDVNSPLFIRTDVRCRLIVGTANLFYVSPATGLACFYTKHYGFISFNVNCCCLFCKTRTMHFW